MVPSLLFWADWVGLDNECIQIKQVHAQWAQEEIKNGLQHSKRLWLSFNPVLSWYLACVGFYVIISNLLIYFIASITDYGSWLISQLLTGTCFLGYSTFTSGKIQLIPGCVIDLLWGSAYLAAFLSICFGTGSMAPIFSQSWAHNWLIWQSPYLWFFYIWVQVFEWLPYQWHFLSSVYCTLLLSP